MGGTGIFAPSLVVEASLDKATLEAERGTGQCGELLLELEAGRGG